MNINALKSLLENLPGMAYLCLDKTNWPMMYVSKGCKDLTGYTAAEMTDRATPEYGEIIHPDDRGYVYDSVRRAVQNGQKFKIEYRIIDKSGEVKWVEEHGGKVICDNEFGEELLQGFITDISKRKSLSNENERNMARIRAIIEQSPLIILEIGTKFNILSINKIMECLDPQLVIGASMFDFISPSHQKKVKSIITESFREKCAKEYEAVGVGEDREDHLYYSTVIPVINSGSNEPESAIIITQDVTESRKNDFMLKSILDNSPNHIWAFDGQKYLYFNQSLIDYLGTIDEDTNGINIWIENVHPEDIDQAGQIWEEAWKTKSEHDNYFRLRNKSGVYRDFWCHATPVFDASNNFSHFQGFNIDITERSMIRKKLSIANTQLLTQKNRLQKLSNRLHFNLLETVNALSNAVEYRDKYTAGHSRNVSDLACAIAKRMGLMPENIEAIKIAGLLHDIGKVAIPMEVLDKVEPLSEGEFDLIKTHSSVGFELLKNIEFDQPIARIVLEHHERIDGSGYPNCKKDHEVLLESKILAVADVVEAMSLPRPYRNALGSNVALQEISLKSGIKFDSDVVQACINLFEKGLFKFS